MNRCVIAGIEIGLGWNDETGEWEIDEPYRTGALEGQVSMGWCARGGHDHAGQMERAEGHGLPTAEELAHMLRSALVDPTPNRQVGFRPVSADTVALIKSTVSEVLGWLSDRELDRIVESLAPILSSIDANAHLRGRAEALEERA